jgi:hypothetical protein
MALPAITLPTGEAVLPGGATVPIRSLSRAESFGMQKYTDDAEGGDVYILSLGTDTPEADVRKWREATPFDDVQAVVTAILELSGLIDPKGPTTSTLPSS